MFYNYFWKRESVLNAFFDGKIDATPLATSSAAIFFKLKQHAVYDHVGPETVQHEKGASTKHILVSRYRYMY